MAASDLGRAVTRMLTRAGHARYGRGAGFKLVLTADAALVVWIPETRRRSRDRIADAAAQAEAHAASARAAGWDAAVVDDSGWPACRVSRQSRAKVTVTDALAGERAERTRVDFEAPGGLSGSVEFSDFTPVALTATEDGMNEIWKGRRE